MQLFAMMSNLQTNCRLLVSKMWLIHDSNTPQRQLVAKPVTPLWDMLVENIHLKLNIPIVTCSIKYTKRLQTSRDVSDCRTKITQFEEAQNLYFDWSNHGHKMSEKPVIIILILVKKQDTDIQHQKSAHPKTDNIKRDNNYLFDTSSLANYVSKIYHFIKNKSDPK